MKRCFSFFLAGAAGACVALGAQPELVRQTVYSSAPATYASWFRSLVQTADGYFYGTAPPALLPGNGSVFRMTRAGALQTVVAFNGANGSQPSGGLLLTADCSLYGTTQAGGTYGLGTIFRITAAGAFQAIHSFRGPDGAGPAFNLIQARDGFFYGITLGGSRNPPSIYRADATGTATVLTNLSSTQEIPTDGLVEGPDGWLYGTTRASGTQIAIGSIYKVSTNGDFRTLAFFSDPPGTPNRGTGDRPVGGLVCGTDGFLYGTLGHSIDFAGPPATNHGSVFRMTTNGVRTTLFSFSGTNGSNPSSRMLLARDGALYGITVQGGPNDAGTIFRVTTNGMLAILSAGVGFDTTYQAWPGLMQADDGNLYATGLVGVMGGYSSMVWRLVPPPFITGSTLANGHLTLTWTSFPYGSYQVEAKNSFDETNWTVLGPTITATGEETGFSDAMLDSPKRFYRITLLP